MLYLLKVTVVQGEWKGIYINIICVGILVINFRDKGSKYNNLGKNNKYIYHHPQKKFVVYPLLQTFM